MTTSEKSVVSQPQEAAASPPVNRPVHYPFWFGGSASCFAAGVTHPLDLGKASALQLGL
jgi:dicarboxylate transporter 10